MKLHEPLQLSAVFRTVAAAAQHEDHWIGGLQLRQPAMFARVIGKFVIRQYGSRNDIGSHRSIPPHIRGLDAVTDLAHGSESPRAAARRDRNRLSRPLESSAR